MPFEKLRKAMLYPDIYEHVLSGADTMEEVKKRIREEGKQGAQLTRRYNFLSENPVYIHSEGDIVSVDKKEFAADLEEVLKIICDVDVGKLRSRINELEDIVMEQEGLIQELRLQGVKADMEQKVLVSESIKVGPQREPSEDIFLDDPQTLLDVEKMVSIYGGELNSYYEEIPTDPERALPEGFDQRYEFKWRDKYIPMFETGRELTEDNYKSRIMQRIGTKKFFGKKLHDIEEAKKIEERTGKLFPDSLDLRYNPEDESTKRKRERNRILKNRFEYLNRLIESDAFTNQEKLMLFAANGNFQYTKMEKYLKYAARYCINANFLIYLLQGSNPNVCDNYTNMVNFLDQFRDASEFRMKLDLARELIEGKWYITAEYNHRITKFQLVPIEEFNELREKVGLPVSQFHYKEVSDQNSEDSDGDPDSADAELEQEMVAAVEGQAIAASQDNIDLPDDGFDFDYYDDDLPF